MMLLIQGYTPLKGSGCSLNASHNIKNNAVVGRRAGEVDIGLTTRVAIVEIEGLQFIGAAHATGVGATRCEKVVEGVCLVHVLVGEVWRYGSSTRRPEGCGRRTVGHDGSNRPNKTSDSREVNGGRRVTAYEFIPQHVPEGGPASS